uniref:Chromodomain-helicase-DNA-binding protein 6-like n=1 Tax=Castor canadensis TaxID=51338 RepID=A0A8B7WGM5_CASCN
MKMKIQKKEKQLSNLKVLTHSPMSDVSVNFDYKSPSPFDCSTDQEEKIEDVASHCLPQKDLYAAEEEADTLFPRKMTSHNGVEDRGGGGLGVKKKRKKKETGEQEGTAKGSKDREPKPKRKREPKEPKEPRKAKEPKKDKETKESKQKDGAKKARKPREASGTKEAKEKKSCADSATRTKSKKARCVLSSLPQALASASVEAFAFGISSSPWENLLQSSWGLSFIPCLCKMGQWRRWLC